MTLAATGSRPSTALLGLAAGALFIGLGLAFGYAARHPDSSIGRWTRYENNWNGAMPGPRTIRLGSTKGFRVAAVVFALVGVGAIVAGILA